MVLRIQALTSDLANQIAAGEVIERPASVVKELLENARDAGATYLHLDIEYAGLNSISIADNGQGIHQDDLLLAVAPHATSKIKTLNDLYTIHTMGFRGEALASIASISRLKIQSKTEAAEQGSQLVRELDSWQITPCARQRGTTVEVRDLFYNAPVRKRFLKSERTEFHAIEGVVRRFALSTPEAAIILNHNGKVVLDLPAATDQKRLLLRLEKLFGKPFMQAAKFLDVERAGMKLRGWISDATYQRSQSDKLWIYVNQRMVRDKLLNHAIKQAFEPVIYPGRHPACLLYLTIDPAEVDVNVHPTKHELRFQQPRLVHDFIYSQITNQLGIELKNESPQHIQSAPSSYQVSPGSRWQISEPTLPIDVSHPQTNKSAQTQLQSLSSDYGIMQWQNKWLLWHKPVLMEQVFIWHCQNQSLPLPSRPLLVPLEQTLTANQSRAITKYLPLLQQAGLEVRVLDHHIQWRSTPVLLPQLPLQLLIDQILKFQPKSVLAMIELLVKAHLAEITEIDDTSQEIVIAFCDAHFDEIEQDRLAGVLCLTDSRCRSILYE